MHWNLEDSLVALVPTKAKKVMKRGFTSMLDMDFEIKK